MRARGHHEAASDFVRGIVDLSAPILRGDTAIAALTVPFVHSNPLQVEMPQAVEFVRAAAQTDFGRDRARGPSMTMRRRAEDGRSSRRDSSAPRFSSSALFFFWGVSNSLNDVLIPQFRKTFQLGDFASSLVQFATFIGYFVFAIPASLFMRRFGYRAAVVMGLVLFGTGALLFYPAAHSANTTVPGRAVRGRERPVVPRDLGEPDDRRHGPAGQRRPAAELRPDVQSARHDRRRRSSARC